MKDKNPCGEIILTGVFQTANLWTKNRPYLIDEEHQKMIEEHQIIMKRDAREEKLKNLLDGKD